MDGEGPSTKRNDLNEENESNGSVVVDVADAGDIEAADMDGAPNAPHPGQAAEILKLNVDCFEDAFDYSPMKDVISIGKTCKRLQQVAGHCFRLTYPHITCKVESDGFKVLADDVWVDVTHFTKFINEIEISKQNCLPETLFRVQSELCRLKEMKVVGINFSDIGNNNSINSMHEMFSKIKVLRAIACNFVHNYFDTIIEHCTELRRLEMRKCVFDRNYDWLSQRYPKLNYFGFVPKTYVFCRGFGGDRYAGICNPYNRIAKLATFLDMNPNIRKFATTNEALLDNRETLKSASNIKLDELAIEIAYNSYGYHFEKLFGLLNELHECGFYQRLELNFSKDSQITSDELAMLNGLVKLNFHKMEQTSIIDAEKLAITLVNLNEMQFSGANFDDIIPFVRQSVQLQKIQASCLGDGVHFNKRTKIIDLVTLNRERQQLPNAQKITLHVDEDVYLATKWALMETNFDLIRLKRMSMD